jgi:hypothetical protein
MRQAVIVGLVVSKLKLSFSSTYTLRGNTRKNDITELSLLPTVVAIEQRVP